ncbi:hypothetical protein D1872_294400 [compost metagenome]
MLPTIVVPLLDVFRNIEDFSSPLLQENVLKMNVPGVQPSTSDELTRFLHVQDGLLGNRHTLQKTIV